MAKTLDSFDISGQPALSLALLRELAAGDCLDNCENILVFGVPAIGESWLEYFLVGVHEIALQATVALREMLELIQTDRVRIEQLGRGSASALQVHRYLEKMPLSVIPHIVCPSERSRGRNRAQLMVS